MAPKYKSSDAGNSSILSVPNLYINFIISMYVEEKHSISRIWYYPQFQAATGGLGTYPLQIRGEYYNIVLFKHIWRGKISQLTIKVPVLGVEMFLTELTSV